MAENHANDFDAKFAALVAGLEPVCEALTPSAAGRPAILTDRLIPTQPTPRGLRARFLMTSLDHEAGLTAYGWRDSLRVVSYAPPHAHGLDELGVVLQEEADFYSGNSERRVVVGLSRVWIEKLVIIDEYAPTAAAPDAWLENAITDPNLSRIEPLQRVARQHHLVGTRVTLDLEDGYFEEDLRAVSPVQLGSGGDLVVGVVTERDWYTWAQHSYGPGERVVRVVPIERLWVQ
ncbi:hypothetical protein [Intrasporangium calvum]|uniref:Uncharacterized protein n=1 Tax=Intrasporangium calvum (strain ATCC 23552 / DSM 43043 / JCM 3097 / NBRC 12989 / NCIMB 10167 / NRRL B-3866 / 7 KIP) TaxID=710696 RepID=E6SEI7_INTC7|nr:hypothetical protein [Intrasporangium calvum]ADU46588.1 hypothetical protein Intca_0026 [Intrasporangium calvum DSM 43043]